MSLLITVWNGVALLKLQVHLGQWEGLPWSFQNPVTTISQSAGLVWALEMGVSGKRTCELTQQSENHTETFVGYVKVDFWPGWLHSYQKQN
jgi:hypothetical protein